MDGSGRARPPEPIGKEAALNLSRACFLEAGWRRADCVALAFVVARRAERAGSTFGAMLHRYSALGRDTARARTVRTWPWGNIDGAAKAHNARWQRLREHVTRIVAGEVDDVCRGGRAMHFGSRTIAADVERGQRAVLDGRWRRLRCGTINQFYALAKGHRS